MNKKEITITAPNGQVIDYNEANGTINFVAEPLDIKERIKTFDDVLSKLQIIPRDFAQQCDGLSKDEVAYRKIKLIVQAFNEGWTPDWTNSNERKYVLWFVMGSPSGGGFSYYGYDDWLATSRVGSRLCFKSSDLAKHAGNLFLDIYKDFLTLNS
ncbi:hypothetical protein [Flavobacterium psychrophilum]|uniref:hypothetical protein n=1 Tax=Flavobacterium psychrophilum TaxID=96345 RepID=UPI000B7C16BE|nr:hypothetical protein [Flavobacterium psychrophilum]SNA77707.1 conserved hypothetical protein [Flavobacterium psychrophilum]